MEVNDLSIQGLKLIIPKIFRDERGHFFESYRQSLYAEKGISIPFVQDNISKSVKDTVRALHYQSEPGQAKLVSCLQGKIWDVAVDIRPLSPTYGQWEAIELSEENGHQFFIPAGFAHGFCVLSDHALVHYKVSSPYDPQTERSIRWNDPKIKIEWPIQNPILSLRDQVSPFL
jgi:dTDP-4-dehydrorhamnose 3,5-epimerase